MSFLNNAKWNSFSQIFKLLTQLISLVYLAKIISPSDYGLMAMAAVIINFGNLLRDLGTSSALIQKKNLTDKLKNTVFWLNLLMGVFIALMICGFSGVVADLYNQEKLKSILIYISIIFPLSSCVASHLAMMERNNQFKIISLIEIFSSTTSLAVAIFMAKYGFGVYSLVGQAITLNLLSAILFWVNSPWRPSLKSFIDISELKGIFSFSANLSLFNFVNYFSRNGDSYILGKYMSSSILGAYNLAYRIMLFPVQSLTFVASRSIYPVLSQYQDDNRKVFSTYKDCVFYILMVTAPLMTCIAVFSTPMITLIFGEQWGMTANILHYLAPTAILQSILSSTGSVFSAKGRTDILLKLGLLGTFLQFGAFLIGVHYSIYTFASLYLIANILNFLPVIFSLIKVLEGSLLDFFAALSPIVISTLLMLSGLEVINYNFYSFNNIDSIVTLILIGLSSALVYLCFLSILSKKFRNILRFKRV